MPINPIMQPIAAPQPQSIVDIVQKNQQFAAQQQARQLANQLAQTKLAQAPAQQQLLGAQTQLAMARARQAGQQDQFASPFGKAVADYHRLVLQYGENSPEAKSAKQYVDRLAQGNQGVSIMGPDGTMIQVGGPASRLPILTKLQQQEQVTKQQLDAAKKAGAPPDQIAMMQRHLGQVQAAEQKQSSDTLSRNRALYAENISKTLNSFDPDLISKYSGITGTGRRIFETGLSYIGREDPIFAHYRTFVDQGVPILADQIRQFYGTSISTPMQITLNRLSNPINWRTNPKIAKQEFLYLRNVMNKEAQTYRSVIEAPISTQGKIQEVKKPLGTHTTGTSGSPAYGALPGEGGVPAQAAAPRATGSLQGMSTADLLRLKQQMQK